MYFDLSPVAFTIGSFAVRWYGIMVALAVVLLIAYVMWRVKKGANLTYDTVLNVALVGIPSGIIFSRLLHVIDYWDYYIQNPGQIIGASGLTIYGAVLGAALGVWVYSRFAKQNFGYLADVLAPGIILAQAIGRGGCLSNGCCYGTETNAFSAIIYAHPETYAPLGIPVHPTQLYEIAFALVLFGFLFAVKDRFKPAGSLFVIYLGLYSLWRFAIGFIREGQPFVFELHQAQVIALVIALFALFYFAFKVRLVGKDSEEGAGEAEPEQ